MPPRPKHALSEAELAALAGVSETTWKSHKAEGCPTPKRRADVQAWLKRYHGWRREHGKQAPAAPKDDAAARARGELAAVRVERARLELQRERREVIPRREVIDYASAAVVAVSDRLEGLIRSMAAQLGPLCQGGFAHVEMTLRAEIEEIRAQFATEMGRVHEQ